MNKRGQSIIEYALIAILVIVGVVFMGPYVLRSVNAHFKLWDEGVQDSFTENITQAPVNDVPPISTTCQCSYVSSGSCGNSQVSSQCGPSQMLYNLVCSSGSVQGCDQGAPLSECVPSPSCCSAWTPMGCGTAPLTNSSDQAITPTTTTCATGTTAGSTCVVPPSSDNCYLGYEIMAQQCGSGSSIQCIEDAQSTSNPTGCPIPQCEGILSPGAVFCPGSNSNLNQNFALNYVDEETQQDCTANPIPNCTYCNPAQKCQVYCSGSYFINTTGTACEDTFTVAPASGACPSGCSCTTSGDTTTYDCSNPNSSVPGSYGMCSSDANAVILSATAAVTAGATIVTPQITPIKGDGCQNPGEPGQSCTVKFSYS